MCQGGPVIVNCGYHTENISSVFEFHLKPIAKNVKSYIKDTNDFLKKIHSLTDLPGNSLCTMDTVGLYPKVPSSRRDERDEKRYIYYCWIGKISFEKQ